MTIYNKDVHLPICDVASHQNQIRVNVVELFFYQDIPIDSRDKIYEGLPCIMLQSLTPYK